jgi:hypothetical protein
MSITRLGCQVSELVNSDTCPRPTTDCALEQDTEHNVDECAGADYTPSTGGNWMMVGCFVSDQDGVSHADPWADGSRCALCSYNVLVTSVKISP